MTGYFAGYLTRQHPNPTLQLKHSYMTQKSERPYTCALIDRDSSVTEKKLRKNVPTNHVSMSVEQSKKLYKRTMAFKSKGKDIINTGNVKGIEEHKV